jgi:hypothetical protein
MMTMINQRCRILPLLVLVAIIFTSHCTIYIPSSERAAIIDAIRCRPKPHNIAVEPKPLAPRSCFLASRKSCSAVSILRTYEPTTMPSIKATTSSTLLPSRLPRTSARASAMALQSPLYHATMLLVLAILVLVAILIPHCSIYIPLSECAAIWSAMIDAGTHGRLTNAVNTLQLRPKLTPWMFPPPRTHNDDHVLLRLVIVQDINASPHLTPPGFRFPSPDPLLSSNSFYLLNSTTIVVSNPSPCNSVVSSPGPFIRYNPSSAKS